MLIDHEDFRPVLKILTDYPRDDLAHDEVHQSLVTACVKHRVNPANADVGAIPGMDTVVAGFKAAQLVFTSQMGYGHVFHVNCAPRKNIVSIKSSGEKVVLGITATGVTLLAVNAGYTLASFYEAAKSGEMVFFQTSVRDAGSQFRSRDYFPDAMAELAAHLAAQLKKHGAESIRKMLAAKEFNKILGGLSFLEAPLDMSSFPVLPQGSVYYVDNFGNIKLNYRHKDLLGLYPSGTVLAVMIGGIVCEAVVGSEGFSQGEGVIALTGGSSGGKNGAFTEIFLRGGRAVTHFGTFKPGDDVLAIARDDLSAVIAAMGGEGDSARTIERLARSGLIKDSFDSTELKAVLGKGDLVKRLAA
jgi:hypothetical protein